MEQTDPFESPRFIPGKNVVRDLCIREGDFVQEKRMLYLSVLRDAYLKLNFKTVAMVKRVAIPVVEGQNYVLTPKGFIDYSSIAGEDHHGKLVPLIINTKVKTDIADLSLAKRCGCACGCEHDYCSSVRN